MAKKTGTYLKINEPHVVHETIDGETILLNLNTGNYYSIEWPGTLIWDLLCETGDINGLKKAVLSTGSESQVDSEMAKSFNSFTEALLEEELAVIVENGEFASAEFDEKIKSELKKAVPEFDKLALNKYSDMKDMLLLDPIHDVDDKGWPEPKKEN